MSDVGGVGGARGVAGPQGDDVAGPQADAEATAPTASRSAGATGLPGRMAAAASIGAPLPPPSTEADVAARCAAIPRPSDAATIHFDQERVTDIASFVNGKHFFQHLPDVLLRLDGLPPGDFLMVMDGLAKMPSDKKGMSVLQKLMRSGVDQDKKSVASFSTIAANALGYSAPSPALLQHFGFENHVNAWNTFGHGAGNVAAGLAHIPAFLGWLFGNKD